MGKGSGSKPPVVPLKRGTENSPEIRRVSLTSQDPKAQELWQAILSELEPQVTKPNYETWLKDTEGFALEGDKFVVLVPSDFAVEWLSTKLRPLISKTLTGLVGKPTNVEFVLAEGTDG